MCYTSGTTGDPKGVVYSHRSIYLHSMQVNMAESMGLTDHDTTLPVVPQFHVNAWGLPHADLHVRRQHADAGPLPAARARSPR